MTRQQEIIHLLQQLIKEIHSTADNYRFSEQPSKLIEAGNKIKEKSDDMHQYIKELQKLNS